MPPPAAFRQAPPNGANAPERRIPKRFPVRRPARISRGGARGVRIWRAPFVTVEVAQPTGRAVTRPAPRPTRPRASHVAARVPLALSSRQNRARNSRSSRALTAYPSPPTTVIAPNAGAAPPGVGFHAPGAGPPPMMPGAPATGGLPGGAPPMMMRPPGGPPGPGMMRPPSMMPPPQMGVLLRSVSPEVTACAVELLRFQIMQMAS